MTAFLVPGENAEDAAIVGGKAAALGALIRAGFVVPPFIVLTADALTDAGLRREARAMLENHLSQLGPGLFAVRSSAREEDGAAHSHAGQLLSLLGVETSAIDAAAHQVWRSGSSESLRAYRTTRGLDPAGGAPAVVVQHMVQARAAGVAFSADPVSGRRDRIIISAIAGLGDRLVGGEVDGDNYVIDRASGAVLEGADQGVLNEADLALLATLAKRVEEMRGAPQDIEWAFEGERLFLLQARPITTALRAPQVADPAVSIFDNSNIVESYPGIVSPLTYSFAQYVYARVYRTFFRLIGVDEDRIRAHGTVFENMLGRIDGRVYYNLINWYRVLALLPGFSLNRSFMETMMGVGEKLPDAVSDTIRSEPAKGAGRIREYLRLSHVAFGLLRESQRLPRTIHAFRGRLDEALSKSAAEIDAMPLTALAAEYRRIETGLLERWDAPLINDLLCMIAFGLSRKLMERWAGKPGLELHNDVMIGQGDIISAEPSQRIARMAALARGDEMLLQGLARGETALIARHKDLEAEIAAYIAKFGDRCTEELKLESITLGDDSKPLLASIAAMARSARSDRAAGTDGEAGLRALFAGKPFRRFLVRRALSWAKSRVRDRENLRFERTRVFGQARRLFRATGHQLHAGGHLDDPRDIFFLTVPEVLGAIEGFATSTDLKGLAALRRTEAAQAEQRADPPERIIFHGAAIAQIHAPQTALASPAADGDSRHGTGCCAGIMRGRARIIRDPNVETVQPGEILVARHTDPGWIALFTSAAAIVVERGSLLSHSAIVARELGIPCVVGLKEATRWLADGDLIEVDGAAGSVRRLDG